MDLCFFGRALDRDRRVHSDHPVLFHERIPGGNRGFYHQHPGAFAVGAVKSLITIRSWWASGLEMTVVGVIEAVVTYGLGLAFGALG